MQRLSVFLGHPTYGLSTVLFSLLLSSGIGSWLSEHMLRADRPRYVAIWLAALIAVLAFFGAVTPELVRQYQSQPTSVRVLLAVVSLAPAGLLMGMAFPIGMSLARASHDRLGPWFWGINGATSVCASVLAVLIAMNWGISTSFWTGCAAYVVAGFCLLGEVRLRQRSSVGQPSLVAPS